MVLNDSLAMALSALLGAEKVSKRQVALRPLSKVLRRVLEIFHEQGYVGQVEEVADGRGGLAVVSLLGAINKCGVIKPRFNVKVGEFEKWEQRYLPAKDFGVLIISTSKGGLITHREAKEKLIGGRLVAYCY